MLCIILFVHYLYEVFVSHVTVHECKITRKLYETPLWACIPSSLCEREGNRVHSTH